MKRTVSDEEKPKKKFSLIIGPILIVIFSIYLTFNSILPNVWSWLSPVTVTERPKVTAQEDKPTVQTLLVAVNKVRADVGVAPLRIDDRLNKSAQFKVEDMLNRGYFEHADPDGKHGYQIASEYAPECSLLGENLLQFSSDMNNTTEIAVRDWVNSPDHYSLITDPNFVSTGFGIAGRNIAQHFCQLP